jgi:hypothetical protein
MVMHNESDRLLMRSTPQCDTHVATGSFFNALFSNITFYPEQYHSIAATPHVPGSMVQYSNDLSVTLECTFFFQSRLTVQVQDCLDYYTCARVW